MFLFGFICPFDFNPRSLTGATSLFLVCSLVTDISIHAPLRERHFSYPAYQFNQNFNPRSFTGATERRRQDLHPDHYFNPRSLTEATRDLRALISTTPISIHAPSRERLLAPDRRLWHGSFNPRSLTGATSPSPYVVPIAAFQSTLPHGSDIISLRHFTTSTGFNPRSLTGATAPRRAFW